MLDGTTQPSPIVVAADGSEAAQAALDKAVELAAECSRPVLVVTVWRELRGDFGIPIHLLVRDLLTIPREWATDTAATAAAFATARGVHAEAVTRRGDAAAQICAVARARDAALIVVGSHGWSAVARTVGESVSSDVVRHAPCPVVIVRAEDADTCGALEPRSRAAA